jgi:hypothetical protein
MSELSGRFGTCVHFCLWALALVGLYLTSRYSLPLFQQYRRAVQRRHCRGRLCHRLEFPRLLGK